ncbi:MAG: Gfo/Idh/MocA family oxidoreductase [Thiolinea sp.]
MATKIAVVGLGKIAHDQHLPAIAANPDWELAATVSLSGEVPGVENFQLLPELLAARPDIEVVSLCVPPAPRFEMAVAALMAGRHLMLEKPPGATLSECLILQDLAGSQGVSMFATWHSREARQVDLARDWLADKRMEHFEIIWREDVRRWHPGQEWIWEPAGMGVFDPGINALSILTKILPEPVRVLNARLSYPENRQTPIAVDMAMQTVSGAGGKVNFDWRQEGEQIWEIRINTDQGLLELKAGGAQLFIDGMQHGEDGQDVALDGEYPRLYRRMYQLQLQGASDVDLRPHQLVADALMLGSRVLVEPFEFQKN